MIDERYVWPAMRQDVALWARTGLQCQRAKVARHTRSEIGKFKLPSSRFEHVHIDLVGFGPPLRLTTDQRAQFEASLFHALSQLGTEGQHTTPCHPAANGQVERFRRQLKAAIMAHGNAQWTTVLPTILKGFRTT
ncbi:transposon Ty3-I Gag-Pol polyprotein [Trichonephila clavipes]|nr:transposon Ty3-I Gag-Pol polyprotein [Trichonephila clavipes]